MRREYRYGEEMLEKMRRRMRWMMPLIAGILLVVMLSQMQRGPQLAGAVALLPWIICLGVIAFALIRARKQALRQIDGFAIVLTDETISREGTNPMTIPFADVERVVVDGKGNLRVHGASSRAILIIPPNLEGIDELKSELARMVGGLVPDPGAMKQDYLQSMLILLGAGGFLAAFFGTNPMLVVPSAGVTIISLVSTGIHVARVGGSGKETKVLMLVFGLMAASATGRALMALGILH